MAKEKLSKFDERLLKFAKSGNIYKVKKALRRGADVNCRGTDYYGNTPLHLVSSNGQTEIADVLIAAGANVNILNKRAYSPLHYASSEGHTKIVASLLAAGANTDHLGALKSPLYIASSCGNVEITTQLLAAGANINAINNAYGDTPLHIASFDGHVDIVKLLLEAGANPTCFNFSAQMPIDYALEGGHHEVVQILLGAAPNTEKTLVRWSIENHNEEQVFEKPEYGVKLVVPSHSIEGNQSIDTTISCISESDVTLPPNVEPVSCFYEISTRGSLVLINPVKLYVQHSVDLTSSDNKRLSFVTSSSGTSPYLMRLCDPDDQMFDPNHNSGVIQISKPSTTNVFGVVWKVVDAFKKVVHPVKSYAMTPFYKQINSSCWQIKVVVTQNLKPFLESIKTMYDGWIRKEICSFVFTYSTVVMNEQNEIFNITRLKEPSKIDKDDVDSCSFSSIAFPFLHYRVQLKFSGIRDLKLEFNGMNNDVTCIVITKEELSSGQTESQEMNLSNELLAMPPKKKHLLSLLNPIKSQWYSIGEQLDIDDGSLKSIKYNETYNDTNRLSEVFQIWMDSMTAEVSWRTILYVVKNPPISNARLELEIRHFLLDPEIQELYLSEHKVHSLKKKPILSSTIDFTCDLSELSTAPFIEEISTPPVSPKQKIVRHKYYLDQIKLSAQRLYREIKQWKDHNNDLIGTANNIADLMIQMSKFNGSENDKGEIVEIVHLIVRESETIVSIALRVCTTATDECRGLKRTLLQVVEAIPTICHQLKILAGLTARQHCDSENSREAVEMLTDNAQNLVMKVCEVLHTTEILMVYTAPPEIRHSCKFPIFNFVKKF